MLKIVFKFNLELNLTMTNAKFLSASDISTFLQIEKL